MTKTKRIPPRMIPKPALFDKIEEGIYCLPRVMYNTSYYYGYDGRANSWIEHGLYYVSNPEKVNELQALIKQVMDLTKCEDLCTVLQTLGKHPIHKELGKTVISRKEIDYIK